MYATITMSAELLIFIMTASVKKTSSHELAKTFSQL